VNDIGHVQAMMTTGVRKWGKSRSLVGNKEGEKTHIIMYNKYQLLDIHICKL
jgi:hypothetical protein